MKRILVIDDDTELCTLLEEYFHAEGFGCDCANTGDAGLHRLREGRCDLIVLDVMLPGRDGFDILREIRGHSDVPVIMLTARGDHIDRVVGLELGADDYICKPFNTRELSARVRAVLRRADGGGDTMPQGSEVLRIGDLEMDLRSRTVSVAGHDVFLTSVEFKLLECLLSSAGKLVPLDNLSSEALKRRHTTYDRSISVHMSNLRRKIGPYPAGNERIVTVRGEGYVYVYARQTQTTH